MKKYLSDGGLVYGKKAMKKIFEQSHILTAKDVTDVDMRKYRGDAPLPNWVRTVYKGDPL